MNNDFNELILHPIAHIKTDFPNKFGIPRQGNIVSALKGKIIFEKEYRKEGILRGIEGFSHLWLIWGFSDLKTKTDFSPTVRPPKLGGNERVGVFASRSPNRPNPLGLSVVKIERIEYSAKDGQTIIVSNVDLKDDTPIYDIKPYIPYCDCIKDAKEGYTKETKERKLLQVIINEEEKNKIPLDKQKTLEQILANDPRPGFQHDEKREYGFSFANMEIKFHVEGEKNLFVDSISISEKKKIS